MLGNRLRRRDLRATAPIARRGLFVVHRYGAVQLVAWLVTVGHIVVAVA